MEEPETLKGYESACEAVCPAVPVDWGPESNEAPLEKDDDSPIDWGPNLPKSNEALLETDADALSRRLGIVKDAESEQNGIDEQMKTQMSTVRI